MAVVVLKPNNYMQKEEIEDLCLKLLLYALMASENIVSNCSMHFMFSAI